MIASFKSKIFRYKRIIKTSFYTYELLQLCEMVYHNNGGSKRKSPNIIIDEIEKILIKIHEENDYILKDIA